MKSIKLLVPVLSLVVFSDAACAGQEVDRLLAEYAKIDTVSCQIRRTKEGSAGKIKFLSRVYWGKQGKLHAEGITPVKRRTIADGEKLWQYAEGDPKGFSRPISELSEQMAISLIMVPGTAMDHLLRLKGLDETVLPEKGDAGRQIAIQTDTQYVVLKLDSEDRLTSIDFFKSAEMKEPYASYTYRDFTEVAPGVWVPLTHEISAQNEKIEFKETVKIDRFIANQPIAESLFIASSFFDKNIDFADDFTKIFPD